MAPGLSLFFLLSTSVASAAPQQPPTTEGAEERPFSEALADAREAYLQGDNQQAISALRALVARLEAGEQVASEQEAEARIYLGEALLLVEGDNFAAFTVFERLLERYPDQPISAFEHPTEVVDLFETARREVKQRLLAQQLTPPDPEPPLVVVIPPEPWWGYLPLGVPQLAQRQWAGGVTLGLVQLGFAAGSIVLFAEMATAPGGITGAEGGVDGSFEQVSFETMRIAQITLGAGFYATWGLSWGLGRNTWVRRSREAQLQGAVGLGVDPAGRPTLMWTAHW